MMNKGAMRKQVQAEEATPVARHFVLIPAAGSGSRFGAKVPKQYLEGRFGAVPYTVPSLIHNLLDRKGE